MPENFTNIAGGPFLPYVSKQIDARKKFINDSNIKRDNSGVIYQNNKNCFLRLTSNVNVLESHPIAKKYNISGIKLAKKFVLQGGVISLNQSDDVTKGVRNRGGIGTDNLYGTLPNKPLGLKPMPGILSIDLSSAGKLGTLQYATIKILAHDIEQLELIDTLYMKLGFTMLLEWGHNYYVDNSYLSDGNRKLEKPSPLDLFSYSSKEEIIKAIQQRREMYCGNYDAMLGTVSNFSWDTQNNGSYICEVKLVGAGDILESLKINQAIINNSLEIEPSNYKKLKAEEGDLENEEKNNISSKIADRDLSLLNRALFLIDQNIINKGEEDISIVSIKDKNYINILNKIFSNCPYNFLQFNEDGELIGDNEIAKRGNHYSLISGLEKNIKNIPILSPTLFNVFRVRYNINDIESGTSIDELQPQTYITLGNLLAIITSTGMIYDAKTDKGNPYLYLDFNDKLNFSTTFKGQLSLDPRICIVPRNQSDGENLFGLGFIKDYIFNKINKQETKEWVRGTNSNHLITTYKETGTVKNSYLNTPNNDVRARLMHLLININYITDVLRIHRQSNEDGNVNLNDFLNELLSGISKSLGSFNNFRILIDDSTKSLRIIDDNKLLSDKELSDELNYTEIPLFGNKSIVYNYNFKSKISSRMASMVTIAAQAEPSALGDDAFAISNLSRGLEDRIMPKKLTSNSSNEINQNNITQDQLLTLSEHLKNILEGYKGRLNINTSLIEPSLNTYKELLAQYRLKEDSTNKGSIIIPLEFNLEMDGISGIIPNSAFVIPTNLLPASYLTKDGKQKVAFIIHHINQNFQNNKWTTKISGQTINIRFDKDDEKIPELKIEQSTNVNINEKSQSPILTQSCTRRAELFFNKSTVNIPINLLKNAAKKVGLTSPYAIASFIAIAAGESGLNPQEESHIYSDKRIRQVFPNLSESQYKRATTKGISKKDFFKIVYGEYNPSRVNNRNINDGGLYYGRGYIQLTGWGNYKRYAKLSGIDILNNPNLVNDPVKGAEIAAWYFKDRVEADQLNPNYFNYALKAVGYNVADIKQKKTEYYNCYINRV